MRATKRSATCKATISAAIADAVGALHSLGEEMQESYDNMPENLQSSEYAEALSSAADTLQFIDDCEVPESIKTIVEQMECEWVEDQRKGISRQVRCNNAVEAMRAAVEALEAIADRSTSKSDVDEAEMDLVDLISIVQNAIDEAEGVEFPSR